MYWHARAILLTVGMAAVLSAATAAESLRRDDPRSSVTEFLEVCARQDYDTASQYLDLRSWSPANRKSAGPHIARKLEAALNDAQFSVMRLTQNPEGSSIAGGDPRETVATLMEGGQSYMIELERVDQQPGQSPVWVFSSGTVAAFLNLNISSGAPWLSHYLPPFLITVEFL